MISKKNHISICKRIPTALTDVPPPAVNTWKQFCQRLFLTFFSKTYSSDLPPGLLLIEQPLKMELSYKCWLGYHKDRMICFSSDWLQPFLHFCIVPENIQWLIFRYFLEKTWIPFFFLLYPFISNFESWKLSLH